jgi:DNA repair protein RadC
MRILLEGCEDAVPRQLPRAHDTAPDLRAREGVGPLAARRLAAALEFGRRCLGEPLQPRQRLLEPASVARGLFAEAARLKAEAFWGMALDAQGGLLHRYRVSTGTLTSSLVHPREVFQPALVQGAASLVVAHNHPSGDPEPSTDDRATTRRLERVGRLVGVPLLDHVVLGAGCFVSFRERGWIQAGLAQP